MTIRGHVIWAILESGRENNTGKILEKYGKRIFGVLGERRIRPLKSTACAL